MEMLIDFPGGARVDAHFGPYTIQTDQPPMGGGEGSAPTPFALFLASIGTCAGIYVLGFCRQRNLPIEGIRLIERVHSNPMSGMVEKVDIEIQVPPRLSGTLPRCAGAFGGTVCGQKAHGKPTCLQCLHPDHLTPKPSQIL